MSFELHPRDVAILVFVTLIWGMNFAVVKFGLESFPPLLFIALRFALVAVALLPFVKPPKGYWLPVFGVSITLGFLHFALMFTALKYVDVSSAAIAIQLQVPFAAILAAILFKDTLGWRRALGMAIAFAGVALIAGMPRPQGEFIALLAVITAALIWAVSNVQVKRLEALDGWTISAWMSLFTVPQLLIASFILEQGQWQAIAESGWDGWLAVAYNGLAVMVIGYGLWYRMLKRYTVNLIMAFSLLIPVWGVMSGVLFLNEVLSWQIVVGGLLTIAGVGIILLRRPKTADPKTEMV